MRSAREWRRLFLPLVGVLLSTACVETAPGVDESNNNGTSNNATSGNVSTANASTANASTANNSTSECPTYFRDLDEDTYGNPDDLMVSCDGAPDGYVDNSLDCNDQRAAVSPDASETCNGVDDNCNSIADRDEASLPAKDCALTVGVCAESRALQCTPGSYGNYRSDTCGTTHYGVNYERDRETSCFDGLDNDCDGFADCDDADCFNVTGACPQILFVSTGTTQGNFTQPSVVDALCQADGDIHFDPDIQWKAVISTANLAVSTRVTANRQVVRPDGSVIAGGGQLFGNDSIASSPNSTASGEVSMSAVWTGSAANADSSESTCEDWTNISVVGATGAPGTIDSWLYLETMSCATELPVYCISQP